MNMNHHCRTASSRSGTREVKHVLGSISPLHRRQAEPQRNPGRRYQLPWMGGKPQLSCLRHFMLVLVDAPISAIHRYLAEPRLDSIQHTGSADSQLIAEGCLDLGSCDDSRDGSEALGR